MTSSAIAAVVTITGADGGKSPPSVPGGPGQPVVEDLGFPTANGDPSNRLFITGGSGGEGGDNAGATPPGRGGDGGDAIGRAGAGVGVVPGEFVEVQAIGGRGGAPGRQRNPQQNFPLGDGGNGGKAEGFVFFAPAATGPGQTARVDTFGGDGGSGSGDESVGGRGGDANSSAEISDQRKTGSRSIGVTLEATGGDGGFGGAVGGHGGDAIMDEALQSNYDGSVVAFLNAAGGNGGASTAGIGGNGGDAIVEQGLGMNDADTVDVRITAFGGDGGNTEVGVSDGFLSGDGGDGFANATAVNNRSDANPNAATRAIANAGGGNAGRAFTPGEIGKAGDAIALAEAFTGSSQRLDVDATARAGDSSARLVNGAYVQGEGGEAIARSNAQTSSETAVASARSQATASGGKVAEATSQGFATALSGLVGATTRNEGVASVVGATGQYFTEGVNLSRRNDGFVDLRAKAIAGSGGAASAGEDFFLSASSIVDTSNFGASGSVARELANSSAVEALGGMSYRASVDPDLNIPVNFESTFSFAYDADVYAAAEGDVFKLAFANVSTSGKGFDLLEIDISYNSTTLLDVAFTSVEDFFNFFDDGVFQAELPDIGVFGGSTFTIDINYVGSNEGAPEPQLLRAQNSSLSSLAANAVAGVAFGFDLLFGGGAMAFVSNPGGGGVDPNPIPIPGAWVLILCGAGLLRSQMRKRGAVSVR
ncbi:MAG: hypothetical protein AAGA09_08325 [Pseudomonadota bacterium]